MGRQVGKFRGKLLALAKKRAPDFVTTAEAAEEVFKGHPTEARRNRLYQAIHRMKEDGDLQGGPGVFALPGNVAAQMAPGPEDDDLAAQEEPVQPMTPARRIAAYHGGRIMAMTQAYVAVVHEEVSNLYRDLGMAQTAAPVVEPPTGLPIVRMYASTSSVRARGGSRDQALK